MYNGIGGSCKTFDYLKAFVPMVDVAIRLASIELIVRICWPELSIHASLYISSVLRR